MEEMHRISVLCWNQPTDNQYYGQTSPCGSYYDRKTAFSNTHQETLKK